MRLDRRALCGDGRLASQREELGAPGWSPLSLKQLVYLDGDRAVVYRSRMNPSLARLSDHIPDPGQHRTLFYGEYSQSRSGLRPPGQARGAGSGAAQGVQALLADLGTADRQGQGPPGRPARLRPLWPAHEPHAFVTDQMAIGKILDHLALSTPEAKKPPPAVPEVLRVAEHRDGWGAPPLWDSA